MIAPNELRKRAQTYLAAASKAEEPERKAMLLYLAQRCAERTERDMSEAPGASPDFAMSGGQHYR